MVLSLLGKHSLQPCRTSRNSVNTRHHARCWAYSLSRWRTGRCHPSHATAPSSQPVAPSSSTASLSSADDYDVELQKELLAGPPSGFDFRAEVTPGTRQWVLDHAPQLMDLVDDGEPMLVQGYFLYIRFDGMPLHGAHI